MRSVRRFLIVTTDSDFVAIAQMLRESDTPCHIIGGKQSRRVSLCVMLMMSLLPSACQEEESEGAEQDAPEEKGQAESESARRTKNSRRSKRRKIKKI